MAVKRVHAFNFIHIFSHVKVKA